MTTVVEQPKQELQAVTPDVMLSHAVMQGKDLDYIQKLMDLQDRWLARKAKAEFDEAFAAFQGECPPIYKTGKAGYDHKVGDGRTEYSHDELGPIIAVISKPMAKHKLTRDWTLREANGELYVSCVISHAGGHVKQTNEISAPPDMSGHKDIIKAKSSTNTYLQRITLKAALGLASMGDDDDGAGSARFPEKEFKADGPTDKEYREIMNLIAEGRMTLEKAEMLFTFSDEQRESLRLTEENSHDAGRG